MNGKVSLLEEKLQVKVVTFGNRSRPPVAVLKVWYSFGETEGMSDDWVMSIIRIRRAYVSRIVQSFSLIARVNTFIRLSENQVKISVPTYQFSILELPQISGHAFYKGYYRVDFIPQVIECRLLKIAGCPRQSNKGPACRT